MGWRAVWVAAALCCALTGAATAVPIVTASGPVQGITRNGVEKFLGIPFAAPPVGPLRWMPPQPAKTWTAVRSASCGEGCKAITS